MADYIESTPFEELPEEKQNLIKQLISSTFDNITSMTRDQRESMLKICYQQLEPELRIISVEEFDCASYEEFIYQIALAAASVDNEFSAAEEWEVKEIRYILTLIGQTYVEDKGEQLKIDLVDVSRMLKPTSRPMFMTLTSLIFFCDKEMTDEEYDVMLHILAP